MKEFLQKILARHWVLRMFTFLVLKPSRFKMDFVHANEDFKLFKQSIVPFKNWLAACKATKKSGGNLFIVAGLMSAQWCQLWAILGAMYLNRGQRVFVLVVKGQPIQTRYFKLFNIELVYLEDLKISKEALPIDFTNALNALNTFEDFKSFEFDGAPIGKMALSTYSRVLATGIMDVENPVAKQQVKDWASYIFRAMLAAEKVYEELDIDMLFFTELFMDYYGGFYYAALKREYNISRFCGTVRDDAIVVTHQTKENDRTHFSSINELSWKEILEFPLSPEVEQELKQNFDDRYSDKWQLSSRNQPNTKDISVDQVKREIGADPSKPIAIIYSHILYDTLFFNGEYLFANYAEWLVESIKAACENPNVNWYVKIHPSNLWRGELEYYLDGIYEEQRLIKEFIGELPDHVKLIYPDTPFSPYTWLKVCDYGVTVTGTSGIELGALGKAVITAGTGRYENVGFTINSNSAEEYLQVLKSLETYPMPDARQAELGKKFAYATFCMKPYTLTFLKPKVKSGKPEIRASEDLVYLGNFSVAQEGSIDAIPESLSMFLKWNEDKNRVDLLKPWPKS